MTTEGGPKFKPGQKVWLCYHFDKDNRWPATVQTSQFMKRESKWKYYIVGESFGGGHYEEDLEEREEGGNYGKYA